MRVPKVAILALLLILFFCSTAYAASEQELEQRFKIEGLLTSVESAATVIIGAIRVIAAIVTVVLIASVGLTLWSCKDGATLEIVKIRIYFIFIGLFVIFLTEPIVRFVLYIFD